MSITKFLRKKIAVISKIISLDKTYVDAFQDIAEPCVQLKMKVKPAEGGETQPVSFTVSSDKFRVLLNGEPYYKLYTFCQSLLTNCLFVCVRSGRILHGAVVFDRERQYGLTPLTSILLEFFCQGYSRQVHLL